jgi:hypothetical protein
VDASRPSRTKPGIISDQTSRLSRLTYHWRPPAPGHRRPQQHRETQIRPHQPTASHPDALNTEQTTRRPEFRCARGIPSDTVAWQQVWRIIRSFEDPLGRTRNRLFAWQRRRMTKRGANPVRGHSVDSAKEDLLRLGQLSRGWPCEGAHVRVLAPCHYPCAGRAGPIQAGSPYGGLPGMMSHGRAVPFYRSEDSRQEHRAKTQGETALCIRSGEQETHTLWVVRG